MAMWFTESCLLENWYQITMYLKIFEGHDFRGCLAVHGIFII